MRNRGNEGGMVAATLVFQSRSISSLYARGMHTQWQSQMIRHCSHKLPGWRSPKSSMVPTAFASALDLPSIGERALGD